MEAMANCHDIRYHGMHVEGPLDSFGIPDAGSLDVCLGSVSRAASETLAHSSNLITSGFLFLRGVFERLAEGELRGSG